MQFGISTYLFHAERLARTHLDAISAHGFDVVELFALRSHVDYGDRAALDALGNWLRASGLSLHSVHAPVAEGFANGQWGRALSIGATDPAARERAVAETQVALDVASQLPYRYLVLHLDGSGPDADPGPASVDAVRRSLETLCPYAATRGVTLALEVLGTPLSNPASLVKMIDQLELEDVGVCLDFGHAHAADGVIDAVETVSGSLWTTHVHDTARTGQCHLVPFDGVIEWEGALLSFQKVGYEGPWVLELDAGADPFDVLRRAAGARRRLEAVLAS